MCEYTTGPAIEWHGDIEGEHKASRAYVSSSLRVCHDRAADSDSTVCVLL